MRQFVAALVWRSGLVGVPRFTRNRRVSVTVRLAIHQDPIAFLPMRVAQTLGYYQEDGLAVETSEVVGRHEGASRRCSAAAWMWRPPRCRMRCNWRSKGVTCAGFFFFIRGRPRRWRSRRP